MVRTFINKKNVNPNDSFVFDDFNDDDLAAAKTEMDLAANHNNVKAVVSISNNANVEGGVDFGLDDDYESVD